MTKRQQRYNNLLPNGIPKYVRCYDNGGAIEAEVIAGKAADWFTFARKEKG